MAYTTEILVIEDNEDDIAVALRAFAKHDLAKRVTIVRDGEQALELLFTCEDMPKVVLLDLKMPRLGGMDVLRRMRSDERTCMLPVVIVSSSSHPDDIEACYRLGANSYVAKQYRASAPGDYLADVARYWLSLNQVPPPLSQAS